MIMERAGEARCEQCGSILLRAGTSCPSCEIETHFNADGIPHLNNRVERREHERTSSQAS